MENSAKSSKSFKSNSITANQSNTRQQDKYQIQLPDIHHNLPAKARVVKSKIPNAYDETALRLEVKIYLILIFFLN